MNASGESQTGEVRVGEAADPASGPHGVPEADGVTPPDGADDDGPLPRIAPSALRAATAGAAPLPAAADMAESEPVDGADVETDDGAAIDGDAEGATLEGADDEDLQEWRALPLATRLEALLFAAPAPLSLRRLQGLAGDVDAADVRDALAALEAEYDSRGRAFGLEEIGGGFQLRTRAELSGLLARLGRRRTSERLSPAAIETLAIVAYRQPVLRVDVEKIRGVASGEVLRTLVEKGMIRIAGRADLPGAPLLYGTTPLFLELFGLRDLRDLPNDRELLRQPG